jgi:hypothetical protein
MAAPAQAHAPPDARDGAGSDGWREAAGGAEMTGRCEEASRTRVASQFSRQALSPNAQAMKLPVPLLVYQKRILIRNTVTLQSVTADFAKTYW